MDEGFTVTFKFKLQQVVTVSAIGLTGIVFARSERPGNLLEYRVIYWVESKRLDEWFYEVELSEPKPQHESMVKYR